MIDKRKKPGKLKENMEKSNTQKNNKNYKRYRKPV